MNSKLTASSFLKRKFCYLRPIFSSLVVGERKEDFAASQERVESLAYQLHNLYCAFEDRADAFENQIENRVKWHANLLRRMKTEIAGLRPALFSEGVKTNGQLRRIRVIRPFVGFVFLWG